MTLFVGFYFMVELEQLSKRLHSRLRKAMLDFSMIDDGDHIMVCLSGGKDSYTLLTLLEQSLRRAPIDVKLTAFHLDQKQPGYPDGILRDYMASTGIPFMFCEEDTYSVVREKLDDNATPCSLCSRLRRGIIYTTAEELGCNKIALGHHRDDSIETLLLNMFHTGQLQGMPAKYTTDDGRFEVIRPMIYIAENDIATFAELMQYPIIPCNLCGSIEGRRKYIKGLIEQVEETIPFARNSMLAAMGNVRVSHLLDNELLQRCATNNDRNTTSTLRNAACVSEEVLF